MQLSPPPFPPPRPSLLLSLLLLGRGTIALRKGVATRFGVGVWGCSELEEEEEGSTAEEGGEEE